MCIADLRDVASDPELAKEFHEGLKSKRDEKLSKSVIGRFIKSNLVTSLRSLSKDQSTADLTSTKSMLTDSIDSYYSTEASDKPGHSKFVNHASGEAVYVDDARMVTDSAYFTKTVAELANLQMANIQWSEKHKQKVRLTDHRLETERHPQHPDEVARVQKVLLLHKKVLLAEVRRRRQKRSYPC